MSGGHRTGQNYLPTEQQAELTEEIDTPDIAFANDFSNNAPKLMFETYGVVDPSHQQQPRGSEYQ